MPAEIDEDSNDDASLYQEFLAEREEILKHKWIQSEEAGCDIGFETALVDWAVHHRETWKKEYPSEESQLIRSPGIDHEHPAVATGHSPL